MNNSANPISNFDNLLSSLSILLPPGVTEDVKKNVLNSVRIAFEQMDFVTREEIEVQETVLLRARLKIRQLELRVSELESELDLAREQKSK